jgi:dihydrofolate reductase
MRKLIATTFVTLDGVMQAPGGPTEDDRDFAHGGWSVNFWDDHMSAVMGEILGGSFAMVLGRRTYEIMAGFWPDAPPESGADGLNAATKYVASRTARTLSWAHSVQIQGEAVEGLQALKEQDGPELQIHGSGNLIQAVLPHDLIDEFVIWTFPVVVGPGRRLFGDGSVPAALELTDSSVSSTGVVIGRYRPAGPLVTGSF